MSMTKTTSYIPNVDRVFVPTSWKVITASTGIAVGDLVTQADEYDVITNPATYLSTVWRNVTQGTVLSTAPLLANLTLVEGSPVMTVVDGGDVAQGSKADSQATNSTGSWSVTSLLKGILTACVAPTPAGTNTIGFVKLVAGNIAYSFMGATVPTNTTNVSMATMPTAPVSNIDRASSAITVTGSTNIIADDFGASLSAQITVGTVTGTSPTLDIMLLESYDNGTTWTPIYHLPRITSAGTFPVPHMQMGGRRRWDYVIGGTSPSFPVTITTMRGSGSPLIVRNFYDRSLNTTQALYTSTGIYNVEGCKYITMFVNSGVAPTPCQLIIQGSPDGLVFANISNAVTTVASNSVYIASIAGYQCKYIKAIVGVAGVGQTLNYINFYATN